MGWGEPHDVKAPMPSRLGGADVGRERRVLAKIASVGRGALGEAAVIPLEDAYETLHGALSAIVKLAEEGT